MVLRTFGLIGYPLSHSFSKKYFSEKFVEQGIAGCEYDLFPLEAITQLPVLLQEHPQLQGLNVTIPYKVAVLPYINELDEAAAYIGAVNCISIGQRNGERYLTGSNTDAYGFEESLKPLLTAGHQKALILGNGGAAKAVKYVLQKLGISFLSVVRTAAADAILYEEVNEALLKEYTVLVNTSPLGMSPNVDTFPAIPYEYLSEQHLCYDLVYNPAETKFLQLAKAKGAVIKNGLEMLVLQAERSWQIWNP
ncbi:shikimate dehydrogenase family protein [Pedobacter sp.]|uniref:shikimate dehydrogenase family protein n=1 Tax=Pedobacter sp. TaxID=1411316 RepID=UPI003D7F4C62